MRHGPCYKKLQQWYVPTVPLWTGKHLFSSFVTIVLSAEVTMLNVSIKYENVGIRSQQFSWLNRQHGSFWPKEKGSNRIMECDWVERGNYKRIRGRAARTLLMLFQIFGNLFFWSSQASENLPSSLLNKKLACVKERAISFLRAWPYKAFYEAEMLALRPTVPQITKQKQSVYLLSITFVHSEHKIHGNLFYSLGKACSHVAALVFCVEVKYWLHETSST